MKKSLALLSAVLLSAFVQISQAQTLTGSTVDIYLSDGGSGNTAISWTITGLLADSGLISNYQTNAWAAGSGFGGLFTNIFSGSIVPTGYNDYALNGGVGGTFTNLSGGGSTGSGPYPSSASITKIGLFNSGGMNSVLLDLANVIGYSRGNAVKYTAAQDSGTFDVSFAGFNPGTYQYFDPQGGIGFTTPITFNLTIDAVPEPSTYALLLLSGAASLWALKRRKS